MSGTLGTEDPRTEIVRLLFTALLGRQPQPEEAVSLADELKDLASVSTLIGRFHASSEFKDRTAALAAAKTPLFVPPGHFYSPVVDPLSLRSFPQERPTPPPSLPGLTIDLAAMTAFWTQALLPHLLSAPFSDEPDDRHRYFFLNSAFSFGDGLILHAMLRHLRPAQIIEVGSGYSSACLLDTIHAPDGFPCEITFVEPFPQLLRSLMRLEDEARCRILAMPVQEVPISIFEALGDGDVLFIDSTHVLKTGSDVTWELNEILPRLAPGVIVHFHDIFYPFEYGHNWAVVENRSWNEVYALRAFLTFNNQFEILFFNDMFMQLERDLILKDAPRFAQNSGGSIWLRRRTTA